MTFPWLEVSLLFLVSVTCWSAYLNVRQIKRLRMHRAENPEKQSKVLKELKNAITREEHTKAMDYQEDLIRFSSIAAILELCVVVTLIWNLVYVRAWHLIASGRLTQKYSLLVKSLLFFGISQALEELLSIPLSLYKDFALEAKHGFNNKTMHIFVTDLMKKWALEIAIGTPVLATCLILAEWAGPHSYIFLWLLLVVLALIMSFVGPVLIMPLFNKYEPLQDQLLQKDIFDLAQKLKFPLTKVYQMDGSKRSNHSNAFMYGFWKNKRIVLFDTLLKQRRQAVTAVMGHELGHWKLHHTRHLLVLRFSQLFVILFVCNILIFKPEVYRSFHFPTDVPLGIGFFLATLILEPLQTVLHAASNVLIRHYEYQADKFAHNLGYGSELEEALINLQIENKGLLDADPLYSFWNLSHPTVAERVRALQSLTGCKKKD